MKFNANRRIFKIEFYYVGSLNFKQKKSEASNFIDYKILSNKLCFVVNISRNWNVIVDFIYLIEFNLVMDCWFSRIEL